MDQKQLHKYVSAFVMSDGGVYYSGKNCRYVRNQLAVHEDFLLFAQDILSRVTKTTLTEVKDDRENRKPCLRLMTKAHPMFTKMRKHFYVGNYKSISPHYLKLLDWEMMAILYQDDGGINIYEKDGNKYVDIALHTKRLSYGDSWLLKKTIKDTLDVEFNVVRHGERYYLRLRSRDQATFLNKVRPFIFSSFQYKLTVPDDWPLISEGGDIVRPDRRLSEGGGNIIPCNNTVQK